MKVVCIKKGLIKNLTEEKVYEVTKIRTGTHMDSQIDYKNFVVINDAGKMKGKFARFANHEVIGVASILTTGAYPDAVNIVVKEIPEDVLRNNKLNDLGI